jgi:hypothetical protein
MAQKTAVKDYFIPMSVSAISKGSTGTSSSVTNNSGRQFIVTQLGIETQLDTSGGACQMSFSMTTSDDQTFMPNRVQVKSLLGATETRNPFTLATPMLIDAGVSVSITAENINTGSNSEAASIYVTMIGYLSDTYSTGY